MILATVDVGSNTAKLLVADGNAAARSFEPLYEERRHVRLGEGVDASGSIVRALKVDCSTRCRRSTGQRANWAQRTRHRSDERFARRRQHRRHPVRRPPADRCRLRCGRRSRRGAAEPAGCALGSAPRRRSRRRDRHRWRIDRAGWSDGSHVRSECVRQPQRRFGAADRAVFRFAAADPPRSSVGPRHRPRRHRRRRPGRPDRLHARRRGGDDGRTGSPPRRIRHVGRRADRSDSALARSSPLVDRSIGWITYDETLALNPRVMASRADIIAAGVLILDTAMETLGFDTLTISPRGLRHGFMIDLLNQRGTAG